jgi:succinoglycan biosynthesis transport protein ExoP
MTTLPQTTGSRLPRPTGAMVGTGGPGMNGLSAGHAAPGALAMTGGDVWRILRAHLLLIVLMLAASILAGYGINWYLDKNYPRYTASGLIQVLVPRRFTISGGDAPNPDFGGLGVEQKTQVALLKNDALITRVLIKDGSEIRKTTWFKSFGGSPQMAKEDFLQNYMVEPVPETTLVKVSFTYSVPEDCQTIVLEMVNTHLEEQKKLTSNVLGDRSRQLNDLKVKYQMLQQDRAMTLRDLASRLNLEGGALNRVGIKDMELSENVRAQTELQMQAQRAQVTRDAMLQQLAHGQTPVAIDTAVDESAPLHALKEQIEQLDVQLQQMRSRLGNENRTVKDTQVMRDTFQARALDLEAEIRAKTQNRIVDQLNQSLADAEKDLEIVKARVEQLKIDLGELSNMMAQYLVLQDEERGLRDVVKQIDEQLQNIRDTLASSAPVRVDWMSKPAKPDVKSFPTLSMVMGICVAVGLSLALGIAFLREMTDTSVRSPRDIFRVGQMSLLGMVSDESDDPQAAGARLPLMIFDAPHSLTAEQLRQVRTRLQHAASLDTTRSLMVTSPGPGDGKTTIACNLAAGLALNGRRILLVDANFRRPEIHKIFGAGNDRGFSDVLGGAVAFDDVVQQTQVPNLSIMTSGPKPINATEMFESQLLIDFIERSLEEFDHVIFDSGPVMVVAEAVAMAPRVDGVITVVRARGNSRGLLTRMRDLMRQVKAEHLGVVLNAVRAQGGGYYGRNIKTYYEYQSNGVET